jgi:hypothetical protein
MKWRRSVAQLLAPFRWSLVFAAAAVVFVMGCVGAALSSSAALPHHNWADDVYVSFRLFFMAPPAPTELGPWLDAARFLAPIVAGYATLTALATLFRDQIRIPWMRGQVVVCGLGYVGAVFLRHLHDAGERVVVIESDPTNPLIELCRSLRVPVIIGDAQLDRHLQAAGIRHADTLIAVCPYDAVNAEIVTAARKLATKRQLHCLARIGNPELCEMLQSQENKPAGTPSLLEFFNTDEISARLLLDEYPVEPEHGQPHILISRLDGLGQWLIVHAARDWYDGRTARKEEQNFTPLWVTVLDEHAEQRVRALLDQYPPLERVCRFAYASLSVRQIQRLTAGHPPPPLPGQPADGDAPPLTGAYVSGDRDELAVPAALRLRQALDDSIPLVLALSRGHGVARLIDNARDSGELVNVEVFLTLDHTCTMELVKEGFGTFETLARAVHRRWRAEQIADGLDAPLWSELDDSRKESSRAQARHYGAKLASVGHKAVPSGDWGASDFEFTTEQIDELAAAEHDRWNQERLADGWTLTLGDKDPDAKKTPYLLPFAELPPHVAEWDRVFVRAIPSVLASAGLRIVPDPANPAGARVAVNHTDGTAAQPIGRAEER